MKSKHIQNGDDLIESLKKIANASKVCGELHANVVLTALIGYMLVHRDAELAKIVYPHMRKLWDDVLAEDFIQNEES
jgi:hypothetical protein